MIAATAAMIPSTRISPPTAIPTSLAHVHNDSDGNSSSNSHYKETLCQCDRLQVVVLPSIITAVVISSLGN